MSYSVKRKVRKYYKRIYESWTQPILSSNGIMGGSSFAVSGDSSQMTPPYLAFNGSTSFANNNAYFTNNKTSGFLCWYNPKPLRISNIRVTNYDADHCVRDYTIQGSDDYINWVDIKKGTNTNFTMLSSWNVDVSSNKIPYKYHRLLIRSASSAGYVLQICLITLTAEEEGERREVYEGDDYDFYTDKIDNYTFKRKKRKYYKPTYDSWTQPILSSNGTIGGSSFAVSGDSSQTRPPYLAFNGSTSFTNNNAYMSNNTSSGFVSWYNPDPLKITNIRITNYSLYGYVRDYVVQACNDNASWVDLKSGTNTNFNQLGVWNIDLSDNVKPYNYHRLLVKSATASRFEICLIGITAQQVTEETEVTNNADYDYYKDEIKTYKPNKK